VCHQVSLGDLAARPGYNTGTGLFVLNGKLYDPNGRVTALRGVNRVHYDSSNWVGNTNGALTATNTSRVFEFDGHTAAQALADCNNEYFSPSSGNTIIPMVTLSNAGSATTGSTSTTLLATALADWLNYYSTLSAIDAKALWNIANEWGPGASSANWRNAYVYVASSITGISGSTVTVGSVAVINPFTNSPFCLIKGAGGITNMVLNVSSTGGVQGAWTVTFTAPPIGAYTSGGTLYGGAVGVMRGAGYLAPLVIDAGDSGQDWAGLVANAQTVQQSDPQQNCIFAYHAYGSALNNECSISSVTKANPAVITLNSTLPYHPMGANFQGYPLWSSNNATGNLSYIISGAQGMIQLNGVQPCTANNIGGSQGAWTITLSVDSTAWGTYTGGGSIVMPNDYRQIMTQLAALRASNVCAGIFEFGPGNSQGNPLIAFNGYIVGTTLNVTSMISGNILPGSVGTLGSNVNFLTRANGAAPAVSAGTKILSQSSGTVGGAGIYTINNSQTIGSVGAPVLLFVQSQFGSSSAWSGPATGPSPTNTSIEQIISACEANLMPWAYWALDDHDQGPNQQCSWLGWFGMENSLTAFATPSDLTIAGMDIVFNPRHGLRRLASPIITNTPTLPMNLDLKSIPIFTAVNWHNRNKGWADV
jgi:hypothetical protein